MYNKDVRESTGSLVDIAGAVAAAYEYDDFGNTTVKAGETFDNEVCYTGQIWDKDTGLYYYNARFYDLENGRFVSQDTYRGENTEPDTLQLYGYCGNNPVNYVDPSGHKYNRTKAIQYARKWCYETNYAQYARYSRGDCANFVSQCLVAGGKRKNKAWHYYKGSGRLRQNRVTRSWRVAKDHYEYFKNKDGWRRGGKVITIKSKNDVKKYSKKQYKIYRGGLLYFGIKGKGIYHATIISSVIRGTNIRYAAHSRDVLYGSVPSHIKGKYVKIIRIK